MGWSSDRRRNTCACGSVSCKIKNLKKKNSPYKKCLSQNKQKFHWTLCSLWLLYFKPPCTYLQIQFCSYSIVSMCCLLVSGTITYRMTHPYLLHYPHWPFTCVPVRSQPSNSTILFRPPCHLSLASICLAATPPSET